RRTAAARLNNQPPLTSFQEEKRPQPGEGLGRWGGQCAPTGGTARPTIRQVPNCSKQRIGKILRLSPTSAIAYGPNLAPLLSALDVTRHIDLPRPGFHPSAPRTGFFFCVLIRQSQCPGINILDSVTLRRLSAALTST